MIVKKTQQRGGGEGALLTGKSGNLCTGVEGKFGTGFEIMVSNRVE